MDHQVGAHPARRHQRDQLRVVERGREKHNTFKSAAITNESAKSEIF
jgi:hypothetical protein